MFIVWGKAKVNYTFCQVGESHLFQQQFIGLSSPELGTCNHVFVLSRARLNDRWLHRPIPQPNCKGKQLYLRRWQLLLRPGFVNSRQRELNQYTPMRVLACIMVRSHLQSM